MAKTQYAYNSKFAYLIIAILIIVVGVMIAVMAKQTPPLLFTLICAFVVALLVAILFSRMELSFDEKGLHYQLFPFHQKPRLLAWQAIEEISLSTYSPLGDFGGWGIRRNGRKRLYAIMGSDCVLVKTKDGLSYYFGIDLPDEAFERWLTNLPTDR